jgi:hypothetical protein
LRIFQRFNAIPLAYRGGMKRNPYDRPLALLYIDTNIVDEQSAVADLLRSLYQYRWVQLQTTDALVADMRTASPGTYSRVMGSAVYPMSRGPFVVGESLLGVGVIGSDEDAVRHDRLRAILTSADVTSGRRRSNDARDAMHLGTAIRYGANGFVTRDKNMLRHRDEIAATFNSFDVMTPERAVAFVERLKARTEHIASES